MWCRRIVSTLYPPQQQVCSLPGGVDPLEIELEEAIVLIEAAEQKDREKLILSFEEEPELQVLNGRYGPTSPIRRETKDSKRREAEELTLKSAVHH